MTQNILRRTITSLATVGSGGDMSLPVLDSLMPSYWVYIIIIIIVIIIIIIHVTITIIIISFIISFSLHLAYVSALRSPAPSNPACHHHNINFLIHITITGCLAHTLAGKKMKLLEELSDPAYYHSRPGSMYKGEVGVIIITVIIVIILIITVIISIVIIVMILIMITIISSFIMITIISNFIIIIIIMVVIIMMN